MTSIQTSKFNVYNKIAAFLLIYALSFKGLTRLLKAVSDFTSAFTDLKKLLPVSTKQPSMPITLTKNEIFESMINQVLSLSNRAYLFASDYSNNILLETFHVEVYNFHNVAEPAKILLAQNILVALNANSAALIADYDITALELTTLGDDITLAQNLIAAPSANISTNKAANDAIVVGFSIVDAKFQLLEKAIFGKFKSGLAANQTLINNFDYAKLLSNTTLHTKLIATLKDIDGNDIEGGIASILIGKETKEAKSDISGVAEIDEFHGGTYHVTFSAPGFISQTKIIKFSQGKTTAITIVLLKA